MKASSVSDAPGMKALSAQEAAALDAQLMVSPGFTAAQLTELAGLATAEAITAEYPLPEYRRVLLVVGPGGNGGDGMATARHLTTYGYFVTMVYVVGSKQPVYLDLLASCRMMMIPIVDALPVDLSAYDLLVDAVFGYSFRPPARPPFDALLEGMRNSSLPLVSIDVPSGWAVDGVPPPDGRALRPASLVSLAAPKRCAQHFDGTHFLGGRFVPPPIAKAHELNLPRFPDASQFVKLEGLSCDSATWRCVLKGICHRDPYTCSYVPCVGWSLLDHGGPTLLRSGPHIANASTAANIFGALLTLLLFAYAFGTVARSELGGLFGFRRLLDEPRSSTRDSNVHDV